MMLHPIRVLVFLAGAVLLIAAAAKNEVYHNEEFGIRLPVPDGVFLCPAPKNVHDHGPVFLLGTPDQKGCDGSIVARRIEVWAEYNSFDTTKRLHAFLNEQCSAFAKGPCHPVPNDLQIPGMVSAAARGDRPDGWIDIIVATQAGTPNPDFDNSVPSVNYDLSLHTRQEYLEEDLRVFRIILETIRLSPR